MKKLKRILALSLSAVLLLTLLGACGDSGAQSSSSPTGTTNPSGPSNPTDTPAPSEEPPAVTVDLSTFVDKLGGAYELPMLMPMEGDFLLDRFPGLADLELPQCFYYAPMMTGVSTAEFVLIQVGSTNDVSKVRDALQARIDAQNSPDAMLYPHEQVDWANNARIEVNGVYILMAVNENCDSIVADFNAFIADPSYVPAPNPNSGSNDPDPSEGDNPPGIGGGFVIPVPGSDTDPSDNPGSSEDDNPPGFGGGVVVPGWGGDGFGDVGSGGGTDPDAPIDETPVEPTGPSDSDVNLEEFLFTLLDSYAFPSIDMAPPVEWLSNYYHGLVSTPVVQRVVCTTAIGFNTAEIALIQVADSSDVNTVKDILQSRVDSQVAGGAFYPAAVEQWELNARVVTHGNYVMMVVHEQCDSIVDDFNALFS